MATVTSTQGNPRSGPQDTERNQEENDWGRRTQETRKTLQDKWKAQDQETEDTWWDNSNWGAAGKMEYQNRSKVDSSEDEELENKDRIKYCNKIFDKITDRNLEDFWLDQFERSKHEQDPSQAYPCLADLDYAYIKVGNSVYSTPIPAEFNASYMDEQKTTENEEERLKPTQTGYIDWSKNESQNKPPQGQKEANNSSAWDDEAANTDMKKIMSEEMRKLIDQTKKQREEAKRSQNATMNKRPKTPTLKDVIQKQQEQMLIQQLKNLNVSQTEKAKTDQNRPATPTPAARYIPPTTAYTKATGTLPKRTGIQAIFDKEDAMTNTIKKVIKDAEKGELQAKYIEKDIFHRNQRKDNPKMNQNQEKEEDEEIEEIHILSEAQLEDWEKSTSNIKIKEFRQVRQNYTHTKNSLIATQPQLEMMRPTYDNEMAKPIGARNKNLIGCFDLLQKQVMNLKTELETLQEKLTKIKDKTSPYQNHQIKMPKLGNQDSFKLENINCVPILESGTKLNVTDIWNYICTLGESLKLSEHGFKLALLSRLKDEYCSAWQAYKDLPLFEAVKNLAAHFDNPTRSYEYANQIHTFGRMASESIGNAIQRLKLLIKQTYQDEDMSKLDMELIGRKIIEDKLKSLVSPEVYRRIVKRIDREQEDGRKITIDDLQSIAQIEEGYIRRADFAKPSIEINHLGSTSELQDRSDEDLEINAIEHKRPHPEDNTEQFTSKRYLDKDGNQHEKRTFQPPREEQRQQRPIRTGSPFQPHYVINNPRPQNRWTERQRSQTLDRRSTRDRQDFQDRSQNNRDNRFRSSSNDRDNRDNREWNNRPDNRNRDDRSRQRYRITNYDNPQNGNTNTFNRGNQQYKNREYNQNNRPQFPRHYNNNQKLTGANNTPISQNNKGNFPIIPYNNRNPNYATIQRYQTPMTDRLRNMRHEQQNSWNQNPQQIVPKYGSQTMPRPQRRDVQADAYYQKNDRYPEREFHQRLRFRGNPDSIIQSINIDPSLRRERCNRCPGQPPHNVGQCMQQQGYQNYNKQYNRQDFRPRNYQNWRR